MNDILNDVFSIFDNNDPSNLPNNDNSRGSEERSQEETKKIKRLLEDGNQEIYDDCTKYSKLSFIVRFYHINVLCTETNKTFSMILDLLKDVFLHAKLPSSFYELQKVIKKLGLGYEKIDSCPNHCMLY